MKKQVIHVNVENVKVRNEETRLAHFMHAGAFRNKKAYKRRQKHQKPLDEE